MNCKINWDEGVFAVPDKVTEGLKLASGKSLKLLIYYLKYRRFPDDPGEIGAGADDIEDAVSYWQQVGVFEGISSAGACENALGKAAVGDGSTVGEVSRNGEAASDIREDKAALTENLSGNGDIPKSAENSGALVKKPSSRENAEGTGEGKDDSPKRVNVIAAPPRKSMLPSEIAERIEKSGEVAFMFKTAEAELKRVLTFDDQRTLLWIHDHLGMSGDVVTMITAFCCRRWGASMAKIEKTAIDMFERDVVTHESVNRELAAMEQRSSYEGKVKAKLGIQTSITPRQREYVEDWCGKGISVELVEKAYYITMETKGRADFRYMGGILKKWYDNGVSTADEADGFDDREKGTKTRTAAKQTAAAGRGGNGAKGGSKSNGTGGGKAAPSYDMSLMFGEDEGEAPSYDLAGLFAGD